MPLGAKGKWRDNYKVGGTVSMLLSDSQGYTL
jgi:hypothetical protein